MSKEAAREALEECSGEISELEDAMAYATMPRATRLAPPDVFTGTMSAHRVFSAADIRRIADYCERQSELKTSPDAGEGELRRAFKTVAVHLRNTL